MLEVDPVLRIDHFRAFAGYWAIPGDAETAMDGQWIDGPGLHIFEHFRSGQGGFGGGRLG